jgi:excisionase family DNA binding protein
MTRLSNTVRERRTAMTVADVAEILTISQRQVYKLVEDGKLPSFRLGGAIRFDPHLLANWLRDEIEEPAFPTLDKVQARKALREKWSKLTG